MGLVNRSLLAGQIVFLNECQRSVGGQPMNTCYTESVAYCTAVNLDLSARVDLKKKWSQTKAFDLRYAKRCLTVRPLSQIHYEI